MKKNVLLITRRLITEKTNAFVYAIVLVLCCWTAVQGQPITLKSLRTGSTNFATASGKLYYSSGDSLFTSNGTPSGTTFFKKIGEPIESISKITIGSNFFFITQTGSLRSLWKSDGTASNTVKVGTYNSILPLLAYKSELYLRINDGIHGNELWKFSAANTLSMVKDINPGSGDGYWGDLILSQNLLFFRANAGTSGIDLWKSDGTSAGTELSVNLDDTELTYNSGFHGLTDVNGTIFLTRSYYSESSYMQIGELWKTQGTEATTVLVKTWEYDGGYSDLSDLTEFNGKLYFILNYGVPYHYLMVSDGTEAGTQEVKLVEIDGGVQKMVNTNNHLVFYSQSQGFPGPIQKSDGTNAGTTRIHQLSWYRSLYYPDDFVNLTPTDSLLFFVDDIHDESGFEEDQDAYLQLYQSDLATGEATPLKKLYNISLEGTDNVVAAGDKVFFTTYTSEDGFKLWYYDPSARPSCPGAGTLLREVWTGIQGNSVSSIPVNTRPASTQSLTIFEGPSNVGDNYGDRLKGYLCVPETGSYRFWIASNDNSELWLSSSIDPTQKVKIASVTGYTNPRQYDKYPSQQSAPVNLVAGHLYYIEAIHKEGVGTDHVSVGMQLPNGTMERPIPGMRLLPYNNAPFVNLTSPADQQTFQAPATVTISADAVDSDGTITKVVFEGYGPDIEDLTAPYSVTINNIPQGDYYITAKAYDNKGAVTTSAGRIIRIRACSASGTILREVWTGIQGNSVSSIPVNNPPASSSQLTIFEGPSNVGTNYGSRIRGYICPPMSGAYAFYISSNDNSELWLSSDDNPANKVKIAYVTGATAIREWTKYPSQRSGTIWLEQNKRYYIEALHKQGIGTDNVAVGWTLPNGTYERPIPGSRLSPFVPSSSSMAMARSAEGDTFSSDNISETDISLWPNPAKQGPVKLTFTGTAISDENNEMNVSVNEVNVEIVSMMGRVMYAGPVPCEGNCETIQLDITDKFNPGVYIVNGIINRKRFSKRLLVH